MRSSSSPDRGRYLRQIAAGVGPRTATVVVALLMLAFGSALVYVPLGLIVPGALMFWLAVWPLMGRHREG